MNETPNPWWRRFLSLCLCGLGLAGCGGSSGGGKQAPPNILFIIMDDVGIDQMTAFGNGGVNPPILPNMDYIAAAGVKFTNTWTTPECSPSRAQFFTGRFPVRTGVTSAITPQMIAQALTSPYETTLPRLLHTAGYTSAMVGKYHLGNDDPSGNCAPATRGFDYFDGNMEAGPPSIDTSAGTLPEPPVGGGTYDCGFVRYDPLQTPAFGACYFNSDRPCQDGITGKQCLEAGGLLDVSQVCQAEPSHPLYFENYNAYYSWPDATTEGVLPAPSGCQQSGRGCADLHCPAGSADPEAVVTNHEYMSDAQTRSGIAWWNRQTGPRMLTVSYNAIHTPFQQPPDVAQSVDTLSCKPGDRDQQLADSMLEYMDGQIAVLLQGLGLATLDASGQIEHLRLNEENTVLVIIGDNGSFGGTVRLPFSPFFAKGTVFQTGVWVPLIIAGPRIAGQPGRDVDAMVSGVDLFQLFTDLAGVDPRNVLPPAHRLDSQPLLAYMTDPQQAPIRRWNYTEIQPARTFPVPVNEDDRPWPCVLFAVPEFDDMGNLVQLLGGSCNDLLFGTKSFCLDNGGLWFGPESDYLSQNGGVPWNDCCLVDAQFSNPMEPLVLAPTAQFAVRNQDFKLIEAHITDCSRPNPNLFPPYDFSVRRLFFDISANPHVDYRPAEICEVSDLLSPTDAPKCRDQATGSPCGNAPACLPSQLKRDNYDSLLGTLRGIQASQVACPGDGNLDKRVDQLDLDGVANFTGAGKSFFDMNGDGLTNELDRQIVLDNLGTDCLGACRRADLNQDNVVNQADADILKASMGPCDVGVAAEGHLCNADLNGDGVIDDLDLDILTGTEAQYAGEPCPIVVVGQDDPAVDPGAVQAAVDQATLLGNGRVQMQGAFNFSGCDQCVKVRGPVRIEGTGDPSGASDPDPAAVTTIKADGALAPFVIRRDQDYFEGPIQIERLWFTSAQTFAVLLQKSSGVLELRNNRITGVVPSDSSAGQFRFGIAGAALGPFNQDLSGELHIIGNHIDNRNVAFEEGDDNGFAVAQSQFSSIEIRDNTIYTAGESIEIEGNNSPDGSIEIVGNDVRTDAAISTLAPTTQIVGFPTGMSGGHPAAIKVVGCVAKTAMIKNNHTVVTGWPSAVCMMAGLTNEDGRFEITGNYCSMSGQFAALQPGWVGEPPFFPPFFLQNAVVQDNVFEGTARFGIPFLDWTYIGPGAGVIDVDLINEGHNNQFRNNDLSNFSATDDGLVFWTSTHDNTFTGDPGGPVVDQGTNNQVNP